MKKVLIFSILMIVSLLTVNCNGEELLKLDGSWECKPYIQNKGSVKGSISGDVNFLTPSEFITNHRYLFVLDKLGELNVNLKLFGKWKPTKEGFMSTFNKVEVEVKDNATPLSDDAVQQVMNEYYTLGVEEENKIVFDSKVSMIWSDASGKDSVTCLKK